jgi:hypothetical protein
MAGLFKPTADGGAALNLDQIEASILRSLAVQMLELLGPQDEPDDDPLARLFAEGPSKAPEDPALARLFPDAYSGPEPEAEAGDAEADTDADTVASAPDYPVEEYSAEFRRFTENDLRARKRDDALAMIRSIDGADIDPDPDGYAALQLDQETCLRWLGAVNDLRLTLGSRLDVTEDPDQFDELFEIPDDDPRKTLAFAYLWLGHLQESLIEAIAD